MLYVVEDYCNSNRFNKALVITLFSLDWFLGILLTREKYHRRLYLLLLIISIQPFLQDVKGTFLSFTIVKLLVLFYKLLAFYSFFEGLKR